MSIRHHCTEMALKDVFPDLEIKTIPLAVKRKSTPTSSPGLDPIWRLATFMNDDRSTVQDEARVATLVPIGGSIAAVLVRNPRGGDDVFMFPEV